MNEFIHIGPAGGNGGKPFDQYVVPEGGRLTAIHLYTEWVINALQIEYHTADGAASSRPPIGGLGGEHHVFALEEDEYLTGISGRAGWYIDSIRFHTNKRVSPLFGGSGGEHDYTFDAPSGYEIAGFFGRSDWYLDAMGVLARRREEPTADDEDEAYDLAAYMELAGETEAVEATVVVRRGVVGSEAELDALEDAAVAEVVAAMEEGEAAEGTADMAVYTQVSDDETTGETVATVMVVATEAGGPMERAGDDPDEVAVMVTDTITSDDDLLILEEDAVEGALDTLLESVTDAEEVDVTIYTGVDEDEAGGTSYAAVVAIAKKVAPDMPATRGGAGVPQTSNLQTKDLERIEGIGPKIAALLAENGISNLAILAETPVERLRDILSGAGARFRLADPATWPEQAALGAAGDWAGLTALQARLRAGR